MDCILPAAFQTLDQNLGQFRKINLRKMMQERATQ
jgi:hypothetical protein